MSSKCYTEYVNLKRTNTSVDSIATYSQPNGERSCLTPCKRLRASSHISGYESDLYPWLVALPVKLHSSGLKRYDHNSYDTYLIYGQILSQRVSQSSDSAFSSASTLNSYARSKHSARSALTLPWPSGMSGPTMNLPSTRMLSMDVS